METKKTSVLNKEGKISQNKESFKERERKTDFMGKVNG